MTPALESTLTASGASKDLSARLETASASMAAERNGLTTAQEVLAAALSDYATLVQVLYDQGHFSPRVSIRVDGREASTISLIDPPSSIDKVAITVEPGPAFRFGLARVSPLAPDATLPEAFASGQPASTATLRDAVLAGRDGWRAVGFAKAAVGEQRISADHRTATLDADVTLIPGQQLRFGALRQVGDSAVRAPAIARIAAMPTGEVFSPEKVNRVAARLRRTGAFTSVSLREFERANPDGTLDFELAVEDQLPRRITFGAELTSRTGLELSSVWIHRNLFGNAERLRVEGRLRNIGGDQAIDGLFSVRLDNPARLGGDNNLFYLAELERLEREHFDLERLLIGVGIKRVSSQYRFAEAALTLSTARSDDAYGLQRRFDLISLPMRAQFDRRDDPTNATRGYFAEARLTPFAGLNGAESGVSAALDARAYYSLTDSGSVVLAGRLQIGSVIGPDADGVSPDLLYFSGGAGSVRGQPFQSLGIPVGGLTAGGRSLVAASAELRARVSERISVVGFYDIGAIGSGSWITGDSFSHSGAGLGLRYDIAGFGPVRLDLALPVSGSTGDGLQFYIGIGQAF